MERLPAEERMGALKRVRQVLCDIAFDKDEISVAESALRVSAQCAGRLILRVPIAEVPGESLAARGVQIEQGQLITVCK